MSTQTRREVWYGSSVRMINACCKAQLTSEHQKIGLQAVLAKIRTNHPDPEGSAEFPAGLWLVKGPYQANTRMNCKYGSPIYNGDLIRLEHITTQNHLHVLPEGADPAVTTDSNDYDNWRVIVEEGEIWKEGMRVMLIHDNTNYSLRICVQNKNLRVAVTSSRETASWWVGEVIEPSWKVPFYTLEPLNHDLEVKPPFVVYGSGICLQHVQTKRNLFSARGFSGISHFSASEQQQISTVDSTTTSTVWVVKGLHKQGSRYNFTPKMIVRNGDVIRLEHYNTQTNLHSHTGHRSAITKQQEVTCFGSDGLGDSNDDFKLEVVGGDNVWGINSHVRLIHVNTNVALHSHNKQLDLDNYEVCGYSKRDANDLWVVVFLELFH